MNILCKAFPLTIEFFKMINFWCLQADWFLMVRCLKWTDGQDIMELMSTWTDQQRFSLGLCAESSYIAFDRVEATVSYPLSMIQYSSFSVQIFIGCSFWLKGALSLLWQIRAPRLPLFMITPDNVNVNPWNLYVQTPIETLVDKSFLNFATHIFLYAELSLMWCQPCTLYAHLWDSRDGKC